MGHAIFVACCRVEKAWAGVVCANMPLHSTCANICHWLHSTCANMPLASTCTQPPHLDELREARRRVARRGHQHLGVALVRRGVAAHA
jgi:hypothetical protein